jgi:hypothetical protein
MKMEDPEQFYVCRELHFARMLDTVSVEAEKNKVNQPQPTKNNKKNNKVEF